MTTFNIDEFEQSTADAMSTVMEAMPEGDYPATIEKYEVREGTSSKSGETFYVMDITWDIDAPEVAERLGRRKLSARQSLFLDIENGKLSTAKGKNVQLGKLREAVGQNTPGWKASMLQGALAKVRVKPDIVADGRQFDRVVAVTRAA